MKNKSFIEYDRNIDRLSEVGKYKEAIELLDNVSQILSEEELQKHFYYINFIKAYYYYDKLGNEDEFYNIIKYLVDNGCACGTWAMRKLSEKNDIKYVELMERNQILLDKAQEKAEFKYVVHLPEGYDASKRYSIFFALHGDGPDGNIEDLSLYLKPDAFLKNDFIFVYAQSSQVYCHNGYGWTKNIGIARREIKACYDMVSKLYSIDENKIVIGGFSGGAMATVDFAMEDVIPAKGFISICPGMIMPSFTKENVEEASKRGVKVVVLEGELDLEPTVQDLTKAFEEVSLPYKYVVSKGIGHAFPNDIDNILSDAIEFLK